MRFDYRTIKATFLVFLTVSVILLCCACGRGQEPVNSAESEGMMVLDGGTTEEGNASKAGSSGKKNPESVDVDPAGQNETGSNGNPTDRQETPSSVYSSDGLDENELPLIPAN